MPPDTHDAQHFRDPDHAKCKTDPIHCRHRCCSDLKTERRLQNLFPLPDDQTAGSSGTTAGGFFLAQRPRD